jgi:hypothetical protein
MVNNPENYKITVESEGGKIKICLKKWKQERIFRANLFLLAFDGSQFDGIEVFSNIENENCAYFALFPARGRNKGVKTTLVRWSGGGNAYIEVIKRPLEQYFKAFLHNGEIQTRLFVGREFPDFGYIRIALCEYIWTEFLNFKREGKENG